MTALRLLGAAFIVFACAGWGFAQTAQLRKAAAARAGVCKVLEQLRAEISERRTPMWEIALLLRKDAPPPCRTWFAALAEALDAPDGQRFSVLWRQTLQTRAGLPLSAEELESLCLLGLSLGRYDAPEQRAAIDRCLREMERFRVQADEQARIRGRLYPGLGLSAGLLLAVLLI